MRSLIIAALLALLAGASAQAQTLPAPALNLNNSVATATGGTVARTLAEIAGDQINIKYFGAKGNGLAFPNAAMTAGSNVLTAPYASFTAADIGKLVFVSGTGTAGAPQSGTITSFTNATTVGLSFSAVTSIALTSFVYGTDDTNAFIALMNALNGAGGYNLRIGYMPGGAYLIKLGSIPVLKRGGVRGDGKQRTQIYLDPATTGDVFAWSEAWGSNGSYCGLCTDIPTISNNQEAPYLEGLTINGSRTAPGVQNAIILYDRNDMLHLKDVFVGSMHGACLSVGRTKNIPTQAYLRETTGLELTCYYSGTPSIPAVELSSTSSGISDATDEVGFSSLHIFGSAGVGLAIRNPNNFSSTRQIHIDYLRIESSGTDNFDIGQPGDAGTVASISVDDYESMVPGAGYYGLAIQGGYTYNIHIGSGFFFSSVAGGGINLASGTEIDITVGDMALVAGQAAITALAGSTVSGARINDNGRLSTWTNNIDASHTAAIWFASTPGVSCSGAPTGSFATTGGIVTHC